MGKVLEKVERRLGEKLFLKGDRCVGPKCATVRRNYPPGVHGKKRRRGFSEYGELLREKQKIRYLYGLDDKDIKRYAREAVLGHGIFSSRFLKTIERRLDNTVFRLGFAGSRRMARHLVSYGHITVDGASVTIPSYRVRQGQIIAIKESSLGSPLFSEIDLKLKKIETPKWLSLDKEKKSGKVVGYPEQEEIGSTVDTTKIKEFYSR